MCELVFCNGCAFRNVDIDQVKMLLCTSRYARENANIMREIAKDKAYVYLEILYNYVRDCIIANKKTRFENGYISEDVYHISDDVIISDLMEEDDVVVELFKTFLIHDYSGFLVENYIDAWGGSLDNSEFSKYYRAIVVRLDLDFEKILRSIEIELVDMTKDQLIAEHHRIAPADPNE